MFEMQEVLYLLQLRARYLRKQALSIAFIMAMCISSAGAIEAYPVGSPLSLQNIQAAVSLAEYSQSSAVSDSTNDIREIISTEADPVMDKRTVLNQAEISAAQKMTDNTDRAEADLLTYSRAAKEATDEAAISETLAYDYPSGYGVLTPYAGSVQGPSGKETYYNLDMSVCVSILKSEGYEGEYWVRSDGCKMFGDYIMCAANLDVHPRGSLVECSLGTCIVADTGGFAVSNPYQLDIATAW